MSKQIFINLKLNPNSKNTLQYLSDISDLRKKFNYVIFVNYLYIINSLKFENNYIQIGAQSGYWVDNGNFTSKVSIDLIASENIKWIILGHCEDIKYNYINLKELKLQINKAVEKDMNVVLCFGDEIFNSKIEERISFLIDKLLSLDILNLNPKQIILAYEPIFAIGGNYNVDVNEINTIISQIKDYFLSNYKINFSFVYGGSVNSTNFNNLYNLPCLDGVLIGSYAWNIDNIKNIEENYE